MVHHLAAFFENQDGAGVLQNLAALNDTLSQLNQRDQTGDFLRVPGECPNIVGVYAAIDATVQPRARLTAPSFRETYRRTAVELPQLSSTVEPGSPPVFNDYRLNPIPLRPGELLGFESLNNPAAAADQYAVMFLAPGAVGAVDPKGGHWLRTITAASAMTADTWNNRALTLDEQLTPGWYDVLAARAMTTSGIAFRLAFSNQTLRPGALCVDARTDVPHPAFAVPGSWGSWGRFHTDVPPTADFLVDAADNEVQVVDLYVRPASGR